MYSFLFTLFAVQHQQFSNCFHLFHFFSKLFDFAVSDSVIIIIVASTDAVAVAVADDADAAAAA